MSSPRVLLQDRLHLQEEDDIVNIVEQNRRYQF